MVPFLIICCDRGRILFLTARANADVGLPERYVSIRVIGVDLLDGFFKRLHLVDVFPVCGKIVDSVKVISAANDATEANSSVHAAAS